MSLRGSAERGYPGHAGRTPPYPRIPSSTPSIASKRRPGRFGPHSTPGCDGRAASSSPSCGPRRGAGSERSGGFATTICWSRSKRALGNPGGARLAESIRRAHPCALIDEFQDTDQVQARIFTRIYADAGRAGRGEHADPASLFVVGDPKQSIYRFRGADIFAYLDIRLPGGPDPRPRPKLALGSGDHRCGERGVRGSPALRSP